MFRFRSFSKEGYLPHLSSSVGFLLSLKKVLGPVRTTTCICYISTMVEGKQVNIW